MSDSNGLALPQLFIWARHVFLAATRNVNLDFWDDVGLSCRQSQRICATSIVERDGNQEVEPNRAAFVAQQA